MTEEFSYLLHQVETGKTTGLDECEDVVKICHGTIEKFVITVSEATYREVEILREAIDFLKEEWSYKLTLK